MTAADVQRALRKVADPEKAKAYARFFKTGKGEYGEGDQFLGITVPAQRKVASRFFDLKLAEISKLLKSGFHEDRFTALVILVAKSKSDPVNTAKYYLAHTKYINNSDLVDTSATYIMGPIIKRSVLYKLAKSKNLWERRLAIVASGYGIRNHDFVATLKIAEMLLSDPHDLIHKATGWMLREVGKKYVATLERFLAKHASVMPRTMLRYAIEKFPETKRKMYLKIPGSWNITVKIYFISPTRATKKRCW